MGRQDAALPDQAPVASLSAPKGAATPSGTCHPLETNPKGDDFDEVTGKSRRRS